MSPAEHAFTRQVLALARSLDLLAHWCGDSRRCEGQKGFPDLVIAGEHGIIFAELKSAAGETSAQQDLWAWTIGKVVSYLRGEYEDGWIRHEIWRPADLASGRIERELRWAR